MTAAVDDAEKFLESFESDPPDGAVLDVRMPPTFTNEGLKAAIEARRRRPGFPVLVLSAIENAVVEEVIVLSYLLHRLGQLGWADWKADLTSAAVRASYHLYQGIGGLVGNFVMGLIFARLYRRWGRVMPLLVAHALIDIVAFVGWVLLAGKVDWLPTNR